MSAFGSEFQKQVLSLCLHDPAFAIRCAGYVEPSFFEPGPIRWLYELILKHYRQYNRLPDPTVLAEEIKALDKDKQLLYLTVVQSVIKNQTVNDAYVRDRLTEFVKRNLFVSSYEEAGRQYNAGEVDAAFKTMSVGMDKVGTVEFKPVDRSFFFEAFQDRQTARHSADVFSRQNKFMTGIQELDLITDGGLARGELGLLCGDAKSGKSIGLNHMSFACCRSKQGKVLHVVLEGSRKLVEDRLDARFAEEAYRFIKTGDVSEQAEARMVQEYAAMRGSLVVRGMTDRWDYSILDIDSELEELAASGFVPDLLVIDYLDLLKPRQYDASESFYAAQTRVSQELHTLATKRDVAIWTATQAGRPKGRENDPQYKLTARNIADSYGKIRTCDLFVTLNFTEDEYRNGVRRLWIDRYRDNEAQKLVTLHVDFHKMIFYSGKTDPDFGSHERLY